MHEIRLQPHPAVTESVNISSSPYRVKRKKRGLCHYPPEKHKLLLKVQNKQTDYEIKKFRLNDMNEIIVGDYTSVRETEPMFERKKKNVHLYQ